MKNETVKKMTIHYYDRCAREQVYHFVLFLLSRQEGFPLRPVVVLCIGSDRYTGDALGPLVGTQLIECTDSIVYGCLDNPVHAGNLVETINTINSRYRQPIIVAVDASLGKTTEIGNIEVWEGGLEAGIAVGNRLPRIGHISIIGVVNSSGNIGYLDLQNTPLSIVMKLAKIIGGALEDIFNTPSPNVRQQSNTLLRK